MASFDILAKLVSMPLSLEGALLGLVDRGVLDGALRLKVLTFLSRACKF